jgi:hypothetical protein
MDNQIELMIEKKRRELVELIIKYGVSSQHVLKVSEDLDDLLNQYSRSFEQK